MYHPICNSIRIYLDTVNNYSPVFQICQKTSPVYCRSELCAQVCWPFHQHMLWRITSCMGWFFDRSLRLLNYLVIVVGGMGSTLFSLILLCRILYVRSQVTRVVHIDFWPHSLFCSSVHHFLSDILIDVLISDTYWWLFVIDPFIKSSLRFISN